MPSSIIPALLDIPEILAHLGTFLDQRDARACVLVSKAWYEAFQPVLWEHVETANEIPPLAMEKHAHLIRTLSLADTKGLEPVLLNCTRLRTLVLWPDALEDEDDDDEDEEDEYDSDGGYGSEEDEGCHALSSLLDDGNPFVAWSKVMEGGQRLFARSGNGFQDTGDKNAAVGAWEWDKVRRDSGIGEDTAAQALDAEVAMLQIAHAVKPHSHATTTTTLQHHQPMHHPQQYHHHHHNQTQPFRTVSIVQHQQQQQQHPILSRPKQSLLAELLLRNPGLVNIEVYVERRSPGGSFWRALAATEPPSPSPSASSSPTIGHWSIDSVLTPRTRPRLSTFQSLVNLSVHQHIKPFLQMCTRLESLDLEGCSLRQLADEYYQSLRFPRLKHLKFDRIKDWSLWSQLLFIRQCHELQTLNWRVPRLGFPVQGFCDALETSWPNLVSLMLPESRLNDGDMAKILEAAVSLSTLSIRRSDFGECSFRALRQHFGTLQQLDLFQCLGLGSDMTQQILESCPRLESFEGNKLLLRDVAHGLWGGRRRGWACHGLRMLDVHLAGHPSSSSAMAIDHDDTLSVQWMVYSQLAKMENLVHLSIGGKTSHPHGVEVAVAPTEVTPPVPPLQHAPQPAIATTSSSPPPQGHTERFGRGSNARASRRREIDGLHLSLDDGLGQLSTLKKLRSLRFTGLEQEMEEEDARWMVEHWSELKVLQGKLHSNERQQDVLETLFAVHGISAWTKYNQPPLRRPHLQQQHPQPPLP
ncbi:hypothetical protein BGX23_003042 [Mortierella sp. AD031]|nr:hypothetical protein BGX23_003042 [Mortierella sp. AD031]